MHHLQSGQRLFRLWIATYGDWRPACWNDAPRQATALELVEDAAYTAEEAALFLEGFNTAMLEQDRPIWAIAIPTFVRYQGDAVPGATVQGFALAGHQPARTAASSDGTHAPQPS